MVRTCPFVCDFEAGARHGAQLSGAVWFSRAVAITRAPAWPVARLRHTTPMPGASTATDIGTPVGSKRCARILVVNAGSSHITMSVFETAADRPFHLGPHGEVEAIESSARVKVFQRAGTRCCATLLAAVITPTPSRRARTGSRRIRRPLTASATAGCGVSVALASTTRCLVTVTRSCLFIVSARKCGSLGALPGGA
jgi:hypothetical protein